MYFYSWGDANEKLGMSVYETYVQRNIMAQIHR
jgi:hypothetical protein